MNFAAIIKKEFKAYLCSPILYIVLTVFLIISGYFFYSNLVMVVMLQGTNLNIDLWQYMFNDVRFILLLLLPLVSMRLFAEEKKLGTIELLFTSPLRDYEIILGKYFACLAVLGGMLFCTLLYPTLFEIFYHVEKGPILAGYLGLFLLGASFLACGMFISSLTENQLIAGITTIGVLLFLWFFDRYEVIGEGKIFNHLRHFFLQKHFYSFNWGVINTKGLVYFVTVCTFLVFLTLRSLKLRYRKKIMVRVPGFGPKEMNLYWPNVAGKVILCFCILIFVNIFTFRYNQRFDLTPDKLYTLSPVTVDVIKSLKEEVMVTVFYEKGERYPYEELLDLMAQSSVYFNYDLTNFDRNPVMAQTLGIDSGGGGIAEYQNRREIISSVTEADIIKAILALTRGKPRIIRFLRGYQDNGHQADEKKSYADVKKALMTDGFRLEQLVLSAEGEVPPDTLLLVVSGPQEDLSEQELVAIKHFFDQGGNILIQLDPGSLPRICAFLKQYNVEVGNDMVIDQAHSSVELDEFTPIIFLNREHPVSRNVNAPVIFPRARSVQVGVNPKPGISWSILAQSGRRTWAETDLQSASQGKIEYNRQQDDLYGPVSVGVIIQKRKESELEMNGGRMIVLGNSTFITDPYLNLLGNRDFFMNMVKWLSEQKFLLADLPPPRAIPLKPFIRLTQTQDRLFFWFAIVVEPLMIFSIGTVVFIRRRIKR
jgi:ABC-2 type transport system permease protein